MNDLNNHQIEALRFTMSMIQAGNDHHAAARSAVALQRATDNDREALTIAVSSVRFLAEALRHTFLNNPGTDEYLIQHAQDTLFNLAVRDSGFPNG